MSPALVELDDEALVVWCRARGHLDDRAFKVLFDRHHKLVWRICYRFMHNREDAEDMTQQVFLKAFRSLHQFEQRAAFKTWLYRIAVNTCQNELRRHNRRPPQSPTEFETAAEFVADGETPEQVWQRRARHLALTEAFQSLRPADQHILLLKDLEDRPYHEIAAELGISLSAAKMRVQRARLALRRLFEATNVDETTPLKEYDE